MLAAIIATDDNRRGDGSLTLCQQLNSEEGAMGRDGSDANYHERDGDVSSCWRAKTTPQTPGGRSTAHIQRTGEHHAEQPLEQNSTSFGYDNMLSSSKTWNKNIASNVLTRRWRWESGLIGGIDRLAAKKKTGNRTTGLPQMEAIGEGHRAFAQEIANTLTDYIIRGVDTEALVEASTLTTTTGYTTSALCRRITTIRAGDAAGRQTLLGAMLTRRKWTCCRPTGDDDAGYLRGRKR